MLVLEVALHHARDRNRAVHQAGGVGGQPVVDGRQDRLRDFGVMVARVAENRHGLGEPAAQSGPVVRQHGLVPLHLLAEVLPAGGGHDGTGHSRR